ncbi:MAG TPA: tRNA (adenosine(37)-N6)-threonylcarbamoyltransferase complex dimerization subunit type 1 TsaB [Burkholderiaceae bacterium]|jgi:tRNA threonylcarbamoyladenosine biosynthesis protein TsaB|nr:tRNA (adenosine(37)-N6)-threonylcarbamoyltransferase complex dimerization subunit type 1 TsaB [Burkholderiaceae bacterium]
MKLLAIDSATERLALAAIDDGRVSGAEPLRRERCRVAVEEVPGGAMASTVALPLLARLLAAQGWSFADLDAVAFGQGPGAFTGLRTACAVAQGLAYGQDIPVVPIDSLALVAEDARAQLGASAIGDEPVWVAMDARMDEIYAGCYAPDVDGGWRTEMAPKLLSVEALAARWSEAPPSFVTGTALNVFGERLAVRGARRVAQEVSRGAALGWLAAWGFAHGAGVPAASALPVYVRDKVAQTTAERLLAKAAP